MIEWLPAVRSATEIEQDPPLTAHEPSGVVPSENAIEPPAAVSLTVPVIARLVPNVVFAATVSVVVVLASRTVWVKTDEVAGARVASPGWLAVSERAPPGSVFVVNVQEPVFTAVVHEPNGLEPSERLARTANAGLTVSVYVMFVPNVWEFLFDAIEIVVGIRSTDWASASEVEPARFTSPA